MCPGEGRLSLGVRGVHGGGICPGMDARVLGSGWECGVAGCLKTVVLPWVNLIQAVGVSLGLSTPKTCTVPA